MPIIPAVFQSIRSNDVQNRPFYAYKHYSLTDEAWSTGSGHNKHIGIYKNSTPHVGDETYNYPINADNTNKHVVWNVIDHRYYRHAYDPARTHELSDYRTSVKHLSFSASTLTLPYMDVGEKIKPGSVRVSSSFGTMAYILQDDENGNLRDTLISTGSYATSSRNIFYMSFNDDYKQLEYVNSYSTNPLSRQTKGGFTYLINNVQKNAVNNNVGITHGVMTSGRINEPSGFAAYFSGSDSYIRVPHHDSFNRFNRYDDWTISFWYRRGSNDAIGPKPIISKLGVFTELYYDNKQKQQKIRSRARTKISYRGVTSEDNKDQQFPFVIGVTNNISNSSSFSFQASDGSRLFHISASSRSTTSSISLHTDWDHVLIRNSSSMCEMFVNGTKSSESGSLPPQSTANSSDVMIGSIYTESIDRGHPMGLNNDSIAELRMYDYAVNSTGITSLLNKNYSSGSMYQTNVAGNVFYRNGQVVISSPMPIYNTGSGAFENTFYVNYRGTHKIYENQVFVRVPKDQFNVSMNPSATYSPPTVGYLPNKANGEVDESMSLPGELRKSMFVSGTAFPYITSIGLYNDKCQMIATAKLAQPIQKRDDVDMNFIVRWDY